MKYSSIEDMNARVIDCTKCPRLVKFRVEVASRSNRFSGEQYWSRGVPGYGDFNGSLLILGLAPAATGANRTGRIFTGDRSSDFLVSSLHEAGITNQPTSLKSDDGLTYRDAFISAVLKCVPPMDKPSGEELRNCSDYLRYEISRMPSLRAILVLGKVAFDSVLKFFREEQHMTRGMKFMNGVYYEIGKLRIYSSYHPSPRNVNTKRINRPDFVAFLKEINEYCSSGKE